MKNMKVFVVSPYSDAEINEPTHGGIRLIQMQIQNLREQGYDVHHLSLQKFRGLTPLFYKFRSLSNKDKDAIVKNIPTEKKKALWSLNVIYRLMEYYVQRVDLVFQWSVHDYFKRLDSNTRYTILNNYGILYPGAVPGTVKKAMYCHDIEYDQFRQLTNDSLYIKPFIKLLRSNIIGQVRVHDITYCINEEDKTTLQKDTGEHRIYTWLPLPHIRPPERMDGARDGGKFTVGFFGSLYDPNVRAVAKIIDLASKMTEKDIAFLIVGSVGKAFSGRRLPSNVTLTGWVDDVHRYLGECDVFLNPKESIQSGSEVKVYEYLKFYRPIITTANGARGYPLSTKNSIIDDNINNWGAHIENLYRNVSRRRDLMKVLTRDVNDFFNAMDESIGLLS